jgi:hypothetical protein
MVSREMATGYPLYARADDYSLKKLLPAAPNLPLLRGLESLSVSAVRRHRIFRLQFAELDHSRGKLFDDVG